MEMIVFIGIQASGKSTFYQQRFFDTHVRISLDLLRTRNRENLFLQACFSTRQRFVIDNTNPTRAERAHYMEQARKHRFRIIGYFFEPDPKAAYERNQARDKKTKVPPAGLFGTLKRIEMPVTDEGFDELYCVRALEGRFEITPI